MAFVLYELIWYNKYVNYILLGGVRLREIFMRILENYETQKRTDLKENRFAAYVRNEPSRVL